MYEFVFVDEECFILYRFPQYCSLYAMCQNKKVIGEQHFCLALKVTLDETNSLQPLLVCSSDLVQLPLVSCFSNRKHSMNSF